jgi:hypothetical protein
MVEIVVVLSRQSRSKVFDQGALEWGFERWMGLAAQCKEYWSTGCNRKGRLHLQKQG